MSSDPKYHVISDNEGNDQAADSVPSFAVGSGDERGGHSVKDENTEEVNHIGALEASGEEATNLDKTSELSRANSQAHRQNSDASSRDGRPRKKQQRVAPHNDMKSDQETSTGFNAMDVDEFDNEFYDNFASRDENPFDNGTQRKASQAETMDEKPPPPYNASQYLHMIRDHDHCQTVGWFETRLGSGVYRFINRYGKRSHAWYRIEKQASTQEYEERRPREENIGHSKNRFAEQRHDDKRYVYSKRHWVGIEAVAWETRWPNSQVDGIEQQLDYELKQIEPPEEGSGVRLPTIYVLGVWKDVSDNGKMVYGWEPKSNLQRVFDEKAKYTTYNAASHFLDRYLQVHRKQAREFSRAPSVLPDKKGGRTKRLRLMTDRASGGEILGKSTSPGRVVATRSSRTSPAKDLKTTKLQFGRSHSARAIGRSSHKMLQSASESQSQYSSDSEAVETEDEDEYDEEDEDDSEVSSGDWQHKPLPQKVRNLERSQEVMRKNMSEILRTLEAISLRLQ